MVVEFSSSLSLAVQAYQACKKTIAGAFRDLGSRISHFLGARNTTDAMGQRVETVIGGDHVSSLKHFGASYGVQGQPQEWVPQKTAADVCVSKLEAETYAHHSDESSGSATIAEAPNDKFFQDLENSGELGAAISAELKVNATWAAESAMSNGNRQQEDTLEKEKKNPTYERADQIEVRAVLNPTDKAVAPAMPDSLPSTVEEQDELTLDDIENALESIEKDNGEGG